jgi:hypothetical protein
MGLKGYRLWVMGQLDSTCRAPPPMVRQSRTAKRAYDAAGTTGAAADAATAAPKSRANAASFSIEPPMFVAVTAV